MRAFKRAASVPRAATATQCCPHCCAPAHRCPRALRANRTQQLYDDTRATTACPVIVWPDTCRAAACAAACAAAIVELGAFYQKEGSRTRLSSGVRDSVLAHLAAAETALAAEERAGKQQGKGKGRQAQMQAEDVTNELLGVPSARTTSVYHAS